MILSTVQKTFILLSCTFLGLICGTLYLYSSYSPQLASQLQYSATNASSIALVGSLGVSVTGPIAGLVVDRKGYTTPLSIGGSGSTFINSVCLKCCAVTFPSLRGVATSLPLALYGLSAMFYSVIASMFFQGDTSGFLRFLIGSSAVIFAVCSPLIMLCDRRNSIQSRTVRLAEPLEMANLRGLADLKTTSPIPVSLSSGPNELYGLGLLRSKQFWILFFIMGSMASLGQMYIYSVGYMVKALVIRNFQLDPATAASSSVDMLIQNQQQLQVGLLSMANCVGRLVAGVMGDIITQTFRKSRAWLLFVPAAGLICTQVMGSGISVHEYLGVASMLSGFFYGYTLCIMPTIVGDVFGMENFSGNWGIVGLAPVIPSFYLTNLFGEVYDSKSSANESGVFACMLGSQCYASVFKLSLAVSVVALILGYTSPKYQVPPSNLFIPNFNFRYLVAYKYEHAGLMGGVILDYDQLAVFNLGQGFPHNHSIYSLWRDLIPDIGTKNRDHRISHI
ncbi:hypothetical protein JCM33374_g2573 [Metschnikowia sp. JCM 33374]|nr:hypothetical protein JCM33374_g2573 [Metschnikowia sp. JCM 33374]